MKRVEQEIPEFGGGAGDEEGDEQVAHAEEGDEQVEKAFQLHIDGRGRDAPKPQRSKSTKYSL